METNHFEEQNGDILNKELEVYLKYSPFYKNTKSGEVKIRQYMEIFDNPKEWIPITQKEYDEYIIKNRKKTKAEAILKIDNFLENAEIFYKNQPYFYDNYGIWWIWNNYKWEITDDVEMVRKLDESLGFFGQTINSHTRNNNLNAMMWVGRKNKPKDAPSKWIQFKDKAISLTSGEVHKITSDYFFTNPIPYEIGKSENTPVMDSLFESWVGKENVQLLYEIIAYCTYTDYPIHRIFCLVGSGSNGKSRYLALIRKFLGEGNFCSTELDSLIDSRFEGFKLYKKLCCIMGETNFGVMAKTSMLKKLSGQDSIGIEKKGKDPFDMQNYAKLLIASNSLPSSLDTSDGFYRRFLIVKFPNQFAEGKDILETIPEIEYNNLCLKIKNLLPILLKTGKFTNEGDINKRKIDYITNSNPLSLFIEKYCIVNPIDFVLYGELYTKYSQYLLSKKMRKVTNREFKDILENEGFFIDKTTKKVNGEFKNGIFINGLTIKENCDSCDNYATNSTPLYRENNGVKITAQPSQLSQKQEKIEEIYIKNEENEQIYIKKPEFDKKIIVYHKCNVENCGEIICNFDNFGVPFCEKHWDKMAN